MKKPKLKLVGEDGNAFAIIGRAISAAKKAGWTKEQIEEYRVSATAGDYDNLIVVTLKHFNVDFGYDLETDDELDNELCDRCGDTLLFCTCDEDDNDGA